jgi:hypothetical protein
MKLKNLFVIDNDDNEKKDETLNQPVHNKFGVSDSKPDETSNIFVNLGFGKTTAPPSQTINPSGGTQVAPEHINKALSAYQQGLISLKQVGYDFQNFYDALSDEDKKNPSVYQMAVRFATSMDKSVTKDKLVQSADYYIGKIQENYKNYVDSGNTKKQAILTQKADENHNLSSELEMLEGQAQAIQTQIADRKNKIASIDYKYATQLSEIDSKLAANDIARDQVVGSLELVKQGIIKNVK